jgi:hypothetical protein
MKVRTGCATTRCDLPDDLPAGDGIAHAYAHAALSHMPVIGADSATMIDRHEVAEATSKAKAAARISTGCGAACAAIVEAIHRSDDRTRSGRDDIVPGVDRTKATAQAEV